MKVSKFGKGKTLRAVEEKENKKAFIKKWLPNVLLVVGAGLVIAGFIIG